jgi:hypothetical protein
MTKAITSVLAVLLAVFGLAATAGRSGTGHPPAPSGAARASQKLHCFGSPRACGYPDPASAYPASSYVGPHNGVTSVRCSSLKPSRSLTVTEPGAVVRNLRVTGRIQVDAPNVTIDNVCVIDDGGGSVGNPPAVEFDATGGTIKNSTVSGANATSQSVQIALGENVTGGYRLTADHDYLYNCSECVHNNGWTLTNTYVIANGNPCGSGYSGSTCRGGADHREDVYCDSGLVNIDHDTLLNPVNQTAVIFCNVSNGSGGPCVNHVTVRHSLLAGGGFVIYECSAATSTGTSTLTFTNNDIARCGRRATYQASTGGSTCGSANRVALNPHGYWPRGGYFGVGGYLNCPPTAGHRWSENFWDDTGGAVRCP